MGKEVRDNKGQRAIDSCLLRVPCAFSSHIDKLIISGLKSQVPR